MKKKKASQLFRPVKAFRGITVETQDRKVNGHVMEFKQPRETAKPTTKQLYVPGALPKGDHPYEGPIATHTRVKPGGRTIEEIMAPAVKVHKSAAGRPQREWDINWDQILEMAKLHISAPEISQIINVPYSTLTAFPEFKELYKKGWEIGKAGLRRMQWRAAEIQCESGKSTMLIFLGKNWLGQRDVVLHENLGPELAMPDKPATKLQKLTVPELEQLKALLEKANAPEEQAEATGTVQ